MEDRWQLYEFLKKNEGRIESNMIRNMDKNEVREGIEEYYFWLENEMNNHVSVQKNTSKNTKSIPV